MILFLGGCNGDSGSPLWRERTETKGTFEIVGVLSGSHQTSKWFKPKCATEGADAETINKNILDWINKIEYTYFY